MTDIDLAPARRAILVNNAVRADERDHRERYKTRAGYIRGAVKRLAWYEITAEDIGAIVTW